MPTTIKTFRNVRTRLYRVSSEVWLAGWMKNLTPDHARIQLNSFILLRAGERICGECYGDGAIVRYEGRVLGQMGQDIALKLDASLTYAPSTEAIRVQVETLEATLRDDTRQLRLFVMDASPGGLGGVADGPITPGAEAHLSALTPDGEIEARVRVMNCRADDGQAGHFRLGLSIVEMSRLDAARWARLLEEWIEA